MLHTSGIALISFCFVLVNSYCWYSGPIKSKAANKLWAGESLGYLKRAWDYEQVNAIINQLSLGT